MMEGVFVVVLGTIVVVFEVPGSQIRAELSRNVAPSLQPAGARSLRDGQTDMRPSSAQGVSSLRRDLHCPMRAAQRM